ERHRAEEEAEREEGHERRASVRRELGKQTCEEHGHLRIAEVREDALAQGATRRERCAPTELAVVRSLREGSQERLGSEINEVRSADELDRAEPGLGRREQRDDARA